MINNKAAYPCVIMKKTLFHFRQISLIIIFVIPSILILYFFLPWREFRNVLPLPVFLNFQRVFILTVAISTWIFFPALLAVNLPSTGQFYWRIMRRIVFALGIPFCCILSYANLSCSPESIYNSAQLDNHKYYLTATLCEFATYDVYKCNEKKLECDGIFHEFGERSITSTELVVNQDSREIDVYRNGYLIYTIIPEP
jgi:hypothetical protein